MPVFISHRHTDSIKAANISRQLQIAGIQNYLDVLDPDAQKVDDITSHITEKMKICTHIIAVVSRETALSWWVPFEIGEATVLERRISTYQTGYARLPEYLAKWPIMTADVHLDMFIQEYRKEASNSTAVLKRDHIFESASGFYSAKNFHDALKSRIRFGI